MDAARRGGPRRACPTRMALAAPSARASGARVPREMSRCSSAHLRRPQNDDRAAAHFTACESERSDADRRTPSAELRLVRIPHPAWAASQRSHPPPRPSCGAFFPFSFSLRVVALVERHVRRCAGPSRRHRPRRTHGHQQHPIGSGFSAASTSVVVLAGIDLRGKNVIVIGGHVGIGLETTRALAKAGAAVTVAASWRAPASFATPRSSVSRV